MKRKLLIGLLALGTFVGYAGFFARVAHPGRGPWANRRQAFERHVAELCTDAALRARSGQQTGVAPPAP